MQAYKASEKRFKRLSDAEIRADAEVFNIHALTAAQQAQVTRVGTWTWTSAFDGALRERPVLSFAALGDAHAGFYVVPDAIDAATQLDIAHACLTEYVELPHVTNMQEPIENLWHKARHSHPHDPSKAPALSKLHWAAAGYHYDWTARKYYPHDVSPVPSRLAALGQDGATACGETLVAEAVIVNFYKKNSTMGGHQDDVEVTMDHPVVSLSLGSDCVFLKGSTTKDDAPLEVLLRSGDLAVLSGASRLSFHGIAKVLPTPFAISETEFETLVAKKRAAQCDEAKQSVEEWHDELKAVQTYLETHRININIRQVYPDGQGPDDDAQHSTTRTDAEEHASKRQKVAEQ